MSAFDSIFGQEEAVAALRGAYLADRLPHGIIFSGPAGVGKATTARALSKLFLCENPKKDSPCGRCESCRVFEAGNHPDCHVVTKDLIRYHDKTGKSKGIDLSINVVRPEVIEPASRKAVMGRGKVFIVEQAESMNASAQNAILKTLEEPAGRTLIVLVTDQAGALLPTVRSRCRTVRFAELDEAIVKRELGRRGVGQEAADDAVRFAGGSLGIALKWIEDGVIGPARELTGLIDEFFSGRVPEDLPGFFRKSADAYAARQLERDELASKEQATREGLALYLKIVAEHLRLKLAMEDDPATLEAACSAIEALVQAETYLEANVNIPVIFQNLSAVLER
jgi:DNA polymerase III delta' subunit